MAKKDSHTIHKQYILERNQINEKRLAYNLKYNVSSVNSFGRNC